MKKSIPKHFQGLLWVKNINKIDIEKDKNYIIHNILMYGTFSDIKWLIEVYSINIVKTVFVSSPKKTYTKPVFRLIKNYILKLKKTELNEEEYIKTLY